MHFSFSSGSHLGQEAKVQRRVCGSPEVPLVGSDWIFFSPSAGITRFRFNGSASGSLSRAEALSASRLPGCSVASNVTRSLPTHNHPRQLRRPSIARARW